MFYFYPEKLGKIPNLTNIFQWGWNVWMKNPSISTYNKFSALNMYFKKTT